MKLTPKQEQFARLYVELGSASEAYRRAYDVKDGKASWIASEASKTLHDPNVTQRVQDIRDRLEEEAIWKRLDSLKVLSNIALQAEKDSDKVSAIKELNSMQGWKKQTIDVTSSDGSMTPKPVIDATKLSDSTLAEILAAQNAPK
jgi:phage terminase small subunit